MSNLRISGLASGMDTDAMVQSMMKVERLKVSRYEQSMQIAIWRQEAYTSMNKMFANFILNTRKDMGLAKTSSTGFLSDISYTRLDYIRKVTSSNETAAMVSATSNAVNGSYTITIENLAKGASFSSKKITDSNFNSYTTVRTEGMDEQEKKYRELSFVINKDTTIVISKEMKKDEEGKYIEVDVTMSDVVNAINAKKEETGITAFYDSLNKRLFMQTTKTGEEAKIEIDGDFKDALGYVNLDESSYSGGDGAIYNNGKDAKVTFNGVELSYSSNNINLNGLNIELKAEGTTNIKVDTNIDGIMEKIEKFVNDYNELVDKTSKLLNEKRYSSYHPLSQEEKKSMHEGDAKLWEEKAKSGLLNRDETLERTLQAIRTDLYAKVASIGGDKFDHITQIGITTEKYARGTTGGKLQIDKDKLRAAIEKDPEGVMELLFTEPEKLKRSDFPEGDEGDREYETAERKNRRDNGGIFTRIYDNLIDGMKSIIDKSGPGEDAELFRSVKYNILIDFVTKKSSISDLDKEVLEMNRKIEDLNAMLYRKEESYYAKFANMEKMLHQMNGQSNWLTQQLMR
jgi:flagellar hook-associated protein 2